MKLNVIVLASMIGLLSACSGTFEGLQRDFAGISKSVAGTWDSVSDKANETFSSNRANQTKTGTSPCPPIVIDPQLQTATEFYDMEKTSKENEVSRVVIAGTQSRCDRDSEYLTMEIDLEFESTLGPKARIKETDKPFFAYPYFVAVKDSDGNELAKELFAVSATYNTDDERQRMTETIKQRLPLDKNGNVPSYQIHLGFQLTEEQLFYNAAL